MTRIYSIVTIPFILLFSFQAQCQTLLSLDEQNKALFAEVKIYTDQLLKKNENQLVLLQQKLDELADDPDAFNATQLNRAIKKAMPIAKANGLDTVKLQKMFELSKKVILRSEFKKYDGDTTTATGKKFKEWVDWVLIGEEKIARDAAKIQEQKVTLYKKVNIAFLRALLQKDPSKSYEEFKNYVDALRLIQSADADILIAEAESLVAEQKLIIDIAAGVPLLGEALDIVSIAKGEDLSGHQLSKLETCIAVLSLATPVVLEQAIKRNPAIAQALGKISAMITNAPKQVATKITTNIKNSTELLQILSKSPSKEVLKWRKFYSQQMIEAKNLATINRTTRNNLSDIAEQNLAQTFTRHNNLGDDLAGNISQTAKKRDEIIITRPTSDDLPARLSEGAYTKGMNVKGKSANSGIASGYVPQNQKFSKLDNAEEIAKSQRKVDESLLTETITADGKQFTITPQRVKSTQLKVSRGGINLDGIEIPHKNGADSIAVFKTSDGKIVNENLEEFSEEFLKKYDIDKAKPFNVLTDMNGNYLAGDIDLLAVGSKKKNMIMQNDELMGNVNFNEIGTVDDLNRSMKSADYPDRQLVHHGGENSFMNVDSKLDFPLTAYSPDGKVAVLTTEKEVKNYFHMQKLRGYNLQPNPYWNWGDWNPELGYK